MKHKILLVLVSFLFINCNCEYKNDTNKVTPKEGECHRDFKIIRINNHQYLFHERGYAECLCHYEDCDYCKKHRNY